MGREAYDLMQAALSELHQKGPEDWRTVLVAPFLRGRPGSYDLHRAFRVSPEEVVNLDPDMWLAIRLVGQSGSCME